VIVLSLYLFCVYDPLLEQVSVSTGQLEPALLSQYQVVVMIDAPLELQLEVNDFCHSKVSCIALYTIVATIVEPFICMLSLDRLHV